MLLYRNLRDGLFSAPGDWSLKRCIAAGCGLLWLDPMPVAEDLATAYEDYYTHGERERSRPFKLGKRAYQLAIDCMLFLAGIPQERRRSERMFIDDVTPGTLLDVGCGYGSFLSAMSKRGWKVTGVDFDPAAVEAARAHGLEVYVGTAGSMLDKGSKFDIVTASHVIEHVPDPAEFLSQCRRLLRPGGRLVLKTPNANSFGARRYGPAWRGLEPPRHLHIFSMQALESCAQRAGFTCRHVFTSSLSAGHVLVLSYFLARKGSCRRDELSRLEYLLSKIFEPLCAVRGKLAWLLDRHSGEEICAVLRNDPPPA